MCRKLLSQPYISPIYAMLLYQWLLANKDAGGAEQRLKHINLLTAGSLHNASLHSIRPVILQDTKQQLTLSMYQAPQHRMLNLELLFHHLCMPVLLSDILGAAEWRFHKAVGKSKQQHSCCVTLTGKPDALPCMLQGCGKYCGAMCAAA